MKSTPPVPLLPSVDLANPPFGTSEDLTLDKLSYLGCSYFTATSANTQDLIDFLNNSGIQAYVDVRAISTNDIINLLDSGVFRVFITISQRESLASYSDRLILIQTAFEPLFTQNEEDGVLLDVTNDATSMESNLRLLVSKKISPIYIMTSQSHLNSYVGIAKQYSAIPVIPASSLTIQTSIQGKVSIPNYLASVWNSDRDDNLLSTIVTDIRGSVLGLVYSNEESLAESFKTGTGVYQSRKRGLWYKGSTSGDTQKLVQIYLDCDLDCLKFVVIQNGRGFCHLPQSTCFGNLHGLAKLENTIISRKGSAPDGSYTARLLANKKLLHAKIMEEAEELCNAETKENIAFETADLIYFALTKAIGSGVSIADIEKNLDAKSLKVKRRKGDAKGPWALDNGATSTTDSKVIIGTTHEESQICPISESSEAAQISMKRLYLKTSSFECIKTTLKRPSQKSTQAIMQIVKPIIQSVRDEGDEALLRFTHQFEKAYTLSSPIMKAPFEKSLMSLPPETIEAINISYDNICKFHVSQRELEPLQVETMPGVVCSRFVRPIERVGLYVPGGTAVLPSTALMLGVPAMVAGCDKIILATPPRADGSISPEIVYVAHKIGAEAIVLAGGAQAVAALAYGTQSVCKVDKILGPGNQFVTAAKIYVSNDTNAAVSIDMPAGPSELLVIADNTSNPAFVASDLLSQAEHGTDSQVILIAVGLSDEELKSIDDELHMQALALPRIDIIRRSIENSITLVVNSIEEAMDLSNHYAPEHLILQLKDAKKVVPMVKNAGSIFIGKWSPESVGDYSAGVNHSLPTYGYAKQYSGVSLSSFTKHITSSQLSAQGLRVIGSSVMQMAKVEELEAHRRAVQIRLDYMDQNEPSPEIILS